MAKQIAENKARWVPEQEIKKISTIKYQKQNYIYTKFTNI